MRDERRDATAAPTFPDCALEESQTGLRVPTQLVGLQIGGLRLADPPSQSEQVGAQVVTLRHDRDVHADQLGAHDVSLLGGDVPLPGDLPQLDLMHAADP